jgi:hypothetical protein
MRFFVSHNAIQERLDFLQIDAKTKASLQAIEPMVKKHLPVVLGEFYDHIQNYEHLSKMFGGPPSMDRARSAQMQHWMQIVDGNFDENYVQSVTRIGKRHNLIGLEPQWYIGGYAYISTRLIRRMTLEILQGPFSARHRETLSDGLEAFIKAMLLDTDLAISTYLSAMRQDRQDSMNNLSDHFKGDVQNIVTTLLASSENVSSNVQIVAAATEQLAASIREISSQVSHTAMSAQQTATTVEQVSAQVGLLDVSAGKIGEIVDLIRDIAEQTNLLALNATIEAARAGDAGKGFAVVAAEVKNLASKTALATKDIVEQIETIQAETQKTVAGIQSVVTHIAGVRERSTSVAAAVEEQQAATAEISRSVHQTSSGTQNTTNQARELKTKVEDFLTHLSENETAASKGGKR